MMARTVAPDSSQNHFGIANEVATAAFAGTITLLPKTKRKKLKIRAFFSQYMMKNGTFSFAPTLSFHAVIPDDSPVFRLVEDGDLEGLKQMLQDGLASVTDCDTRGRSLLAVCSIHPTLMLTNLGEVYHKS